MGRASKQQDVWQQVHLRVSYSKNVLLLRFLDAHMHVPYRVTVLHRDNSTTLRRHQVMGDAAGILVATAGVCTGPAHHGSNQEYLARHRRVCPIRILSKSCF